MNKQINHYDRFMKIFNKLSDEEIIDALNEEVGKGGWGRARASYLVALNDQINLRNLDRSEFGYYGISLRRKVKLVDKKIVVIPNSEPKVLKGGVFRVKFDKKEKDGFKLTPIDKRMTLS